MPDRKPLLPKQSSASIAREIIPEQRSPAVEVFPRAVAADAFTSADPIRQYKSGRTCSAPGCNTRLSIYNPSDRCSQHPRTKLLAKGSGVPKIVRIDSKKVRKSQRRKAQKRREV